MVDLGKCPYPIAFGGGTRCYETGNMVMKSRLEMLFWCLFSSVVFAVKKSSSDIRYAFIVACVCL